MPSRPPGNPIPRGSAHLAVSEHDVQLTEHHVPILAPGVPVLHDALGRQVEHPAQRIIVGKGRLVLCDLPELAVQALDDVRRVYDFPNLNGVLGLSQILCKRRNAVQIEQNLFKAEVAQAAAALFSK